MAILCGICTNLCVAMPAGIGDCWIHFVHSLRVSIPAHLNSKYFFFYPELGKLLTFY